MNPAEYFFARERRQTEKKLTEQAAVITDDYRQSLQERIDIIDHIAEHTCTPGEALFELQFMLGAAEHNRDVIPRLHWRERDIAYERIAIIRDLHERFSEWLCGDTE